VILHRQLFRLAQLLFLGFFIGVFPLSVMATEEDAGAAQGFFDARVGVGYKAISTQYEPGRADEYSYHHSSPVGVVHLYNWEDMRGFSLLGDYRNEADYHAELDLNHRGLVRFRLTTASMFHNLDHLPFDDVNRPDAFKTTPTPWVNFQDLNPGDEYFVKAKQTDALLRVKPGTYPAHINLEYWRLERSGRKQLRFVNHGSDPSGTDSCTSCHVRSQNRTLNQVTEEVKGSVDAHLGYVDLIAEQLYREFRDRESIPLDDFPSSSFVRNSGNFQHDEEPDSRLFSTTVKVHTALSGGVTGAATFTIGRRENQTNLSDVQGVRSETDFRKGTADGTWILSPQWTFNLLYRILDMDNSNSSSLVSASEAASVEVRDNVDLTRASYAARISYRPTRNWTVKGDFERKEIHRDHVGAATLAEPDPVWELPKDENINRLRVSLYGRPLGVRKLKLNAWYEYLTSDDPAYGTSTEEGHEGFVGLIWNPTARVGLNASVRGLRQENRNQTFTQHSFNFGTDDTLHFFEEDRRQEKTDFVAGLWWNPVDALALTLNYGFLRTRTLQDLIFSTHAFSATPGDPAYFVQDDDLENIQRVNTASVGLNWRLLEVLKARVEGRYITSYAAWDPRFALEAPAGIPVNSDGLKKATRLDIRQKGASVGLDWSPKAEWTCSAQYTFDDYEDRDSNIFDGSVQTYMASVSRSW